MLMMGKVRLRDSELAKSVHDELSAYSREGEGIAVVETAGGVLSPGPSGALQADLYRPLRLPVILVADSRLGGIGSSVSAFESLKLRGYDIDAVLCFGGPEAANLEYLRDYFRSHSVQTYGLLEPPPRDNDEDVDQRNTREYYGSLNHAKTFERVVDTIRRQHRRRIGDIDSLPGRANKSIWHPFQQHQLQSEKNIMAIDSAYGDFFQIGNPETVQSEKRSGKGEQSALQTSVLRPAFDGSASWWTQGLGHGNPKLSLAAAYAAGRYGHVMFAGAVHEPALLLAETLLQNLQNPRLQKVFYTDNGSTGMEVAVKMALRASAQRYGWDSTSDEILMLGLKGSYHGDTIGVMDCSEPSTFNKKVEWYRGRGYWFDFPTVKMRRGRWFVEPPKGLEAEFGRSRSFKSLQEIFDVNKRDSSRYEAYIKATLERLSAEGKKFGALVMEPVVLGAGGMHLADPLFQQTLVDVVRRNYRFFGDELGSVTLRTATDQHAWKGLPVVFDEVFTGLFRLGRFSSASFLDVHPDISVHAKLLTGGLVPLCTTLASQSIFNAFLSKDKSDALLHGHSYTAHAVGCNVALESLLEMTQMEKSGDWAGFQRSWMGGDMFKRLRPDSENERQQTISIWSMWSNPFVSQLSQKETVDSVFALGSVLAVSIRDQAGSGYTSTAAVGLQKKLLQDAGPHGWVVHSRILGNVLYLMASQTSKMETLRAIEKMLLEAL
ncbi:hypothetical protein H2201_000325 [Coniosporium apollinis]|uniref:Adenosylmethionine-8-amino-7-oxononanoate aminotransferase n=2 Tax=Coniosporium TaxID=2810619 RepID=A0ABQ9P9A8_9PEZI|nr:hypothetical protein H2199_003514 [Cladosporium sp. JES 115]KAJ9669458.1 hypothetical protein H2201_000325 [Coniosporium apollinis]